MFTKKFRPIPSAGHEAVMQQSIFLKIHACFKCTSRRGSSTCKL